MITDQSILILAVDIHNKQNNGISCLYISGTWYNIQTFLQGKYLLQNVPRQSLAVCILSRQSAQGFMPDEHHLSLTLDWSELGSHSCTIG